jgi:hypothetical protein
MDNLRFLRRRWRQYNLYRSNVMPVSFLQWYQQAARRRGENIAAPSSKRAKSGGDSSAATTPSRRGHRAQRCGRARKDNGAGHIHIGRTVSRHIALARAACIFLLTRCSLLPRTSARFIVSLGGFGRGGRDSVCSSLIGVMVRLFPHGEIRWRPEHIRRLFVYCVCGGSSV